MVGLAARKIRAVSFPQRADERVAMLPADFAVLVAVAGITPGLGAPPQRGGRRPVPLAPVRQQPRFVGGAPRKYHWLNEALARILIRSLAPPSASRRLRDASAPAPPGGSAVSESGRTIKHALLYLRLAAECRGIAAEVNEPDLRAHFLRSASAWTDLAERGPILH
jgi:hypothetical protein